MIRSRFLNVSIRISAMLLCSFFSGQLQAQSLGITPAFLETKVKRGATHTAAFSISNNTNARVRFHTATGDYWYDEQNRRLTGPAGTLPRSASNWVQFVPTEFVVEAMSSITVKAIITIPEAANGSYYTMPIFEGEAAEAPVSQKEGSLGASVVVRFCGLLMLTTEDTAEYSVEIMNASVTPPTAANALEMKLALRNRGTAHARTRGIFAILNSRNELAGRGRFDEKTLLPGQGNELKTQWTGDLAPDSYRIVVTVSYERVGLEPATLLYEIPFDVK